jgi:hypothetical protein
MGKVVLIEELNKDRYSLVVSTTDFSPGMYYLSLQCKNETIETEKVIINP